MQSLADRLPPEIARAMPGCVATGDSVEATERLLREAIEIHVAGLREDGLPIPEPSSVVDYLEVSA
jgi:predicted RNase H-like HicB family nuclease